MNNALKEYIEQKIVPLYDDFDAAHDRRHVRSVIDTSLELARHYRVDTDMVYTIAAYHDTGLTTGRERHHIDSGRIIMSDSRLRDWFSECQIEIMRDAAEDHRASTDHPPRTIYGRIVAEADRQIDSNITLVRTVQYGLNHYPQLTRKEQQERFVAHLDQKYGEGGYLKLWIPESGNGARLEELRRLIADREELGRSFERIFDQLTAH